MTIIVRPWRRLRAPMFVVMLACAALSTGTALAQTDSQKQSAKEHFEKASRLYDVGRYQDAIEEYQKAYLNVEDPVFLYNIAQCYRLSDRPVEALRFYRNYLRKAPNAPNRAVVEQRISEMEKLAQEREKAGPPATGTTEPPPAGTTTPPPAGTTTPPVVTAPPPAGTAPPPVVPGPVAAVPPATPDLTAKATPQPSHGRKSLAYGLMIGGGAGIVVAALAGAGAAAKAHTVETSKRFNPDDEKAGKTLNALAIGFGIAGAAAAVVGGVLLFTDHSSTEVATASGGSRSRTPRLAPLLAPGLAGAQAAFVF